MPRPNDPITPLEAVNIAHEVLLYAERRPRKPITVERVVALARLIEGRAPDDRRGIALRVETHLRMLGVLGARKPEGPQLPSLSNAELAEAAGALRP